MKALHERHHTFYQGHCCFYVEEQVSHADGSISACVAVEHVAKVQHSNFPLVNHQVVVVGVVVDNGAPQLWKQIIKQEELTVKYLRGKVTAFILSINDQKVDSDAGPRRGPGAARLGLAPGRHSSESRPLPNTVGGPRPLPDPNIVHLGSTRTSDVQQHGQNPAKPWKSLWNQKERS